MSNPTWRLFAVLAIAVLAFSACNGEEPDPAAEPDPDDPEIPEEELAEEEMPEELFEEPELPPIDAIRITYVATAPDPADPGAEAPPEEFVVSWDPPLIAVIFDDGRIMHTAEDETVLCTEEEGEAECMRMPEGQDGPQMVLQSFIPFFGAGVTAEEDIPGAQQIDDRDIADRAATCFSIDAPAGPQPENGEEDAGGAELCADQETGATLLFVSTGPQGDQSVEALAVDAPETSDFEPIAPVEDAPDPQMPPPDDE